MAANNKAGKMYRLCWKRPGEDVTPFEFEATDYLDAIDHARKCCREAGAEFYSVDIVADWAKHGKQSSKEAA